MQTEETDNTTEVRFIATLSQVNAAKTLKVVLEPFGSKGVSAIQSLVPMAEAQVEVIIRSTQSELPLDEDEEPSVCEGQVTIDESGTIVEVEFVQPVPYTPDDGTLAVECLSMEEIADRFPDSPEEAFTPAEEVPFEPAPDEEWDEDTDDDAPPSAPEDEPGAEPTLSDIEDAMFTEASESVSESVIPTLPTLPTREKVIEAYRHLMSHPADAHFSFRGDGGVNYTFKKSGDDTTVRLTIGDAPDDDFAITAALTLFAPIPATSVSISKDKRKFTISLPLWTAKGNVAEDEPVL